MILRSLFAFALLALLAQPAQAQQSSGLPQSPACTNAYTSCQSACTRQHGDDAAGGSGCFARCAADRAACDAAAGYNAAKPWVKEQIDQVWRFIEGFMGPDGKTQQSPPQRSYPSQPEYEKKKDWNNKDWDREEHDGGDDNQGEDT